jgi:hypothetical protein
MSKKLQNRRGSVRTGIAVSLREAVNLFKHVFRERDIYTNCLANVCLDTNKDDDAVSVIWIGHNRFKAGGLRNSLAVRNHTLDMKSQCFFSHSARVIQRLSGGHDSRKSGKDTPKSLSASLWITPI